jgi:hypothetical protein
MNTELTQGEMVDIVENNIKRINAQIYDGVIMKRVAVKSNDAEMVKRADDMLIKLEKAKDEYQVILKEIKGEITCNQKGKNR